MNIVIAPDSFKESLSAIEVARAIEKGLISVFTNANITNIPMADGGEGTVQTLVDATDGELISVQVSGPLKKPVEAFYGLIGDQTTAVIEMAAASGLHHTATDQRDAKLTCSFGTGELINHALNQNVSEIIIGLGGSATNDGGAGMLSALGAKLLDKDGQLIKSGGAALKHLDSIDTTNLNPKLANVTITVACDVDNPLCGNKGASAVFGPQKGANAADVIELDLCLKNLGNKLKEICATDVAQVNGSGAAGGMGASLLALDAQLLPGVDIIIDKLNLVDSVKGADLVITGEGRIDSQTIHGKTPIGVAKVAKQFDVPVIAIAGCVSDDYHVVLDHGIDAVFPIISQLSTLEQLLANAAPNLERTAINIANTLKLQRNT
ncbi:glycerate kinase [Thalassotalea crassostreae]|uniref:glycerate kinase n=1 Tax=Thalassotalea crassostreae TaxID=1763536 RepID=UPI000838E6C7|nr:glycerate kinase [Thalassotalea crassostreae]